MILSRPKIFPQERFDLEDLNTLLSAARTDSKFHTKEFEANLNYVLKGFSVSGIGLTQATVNMADATLIIPQGTSDFSWFIAPVGASNIIIPATSFTDGTRNYVEARLISSDGTNLARAFWDPDANSGAGAEFSQSVNTVTDLSVEFVVLTGGFSGSGDRVPICIIDVDGSGAIKTILDRRELFHRLSKPENINNTFSWGTKQEPGYAVTLSAVTGTFISGEQLMINTENATCVTGGTSSLNFNEPSGINFFPGSTITGLTSGAIGTISTIFESFSGVDKSIVNKKNLFDALMTEIKVMKNTKYWWQDAGASLGGLASFMDSLLVQSVIGATFGWSGSEMSISDSSLSPASSDVEGRLRLLGRGDDLNLCRQDGTGGTTTISLAEKQVMFIQVPATGSRTYSGVGASSSNYQVVDIGDFVPSDANYWIAYREVNKLYVRGYGELDVGESVIINDPMKEVLQAEIDAINAVLNSPTYEESLKIISGSTSGNNLHGPIITGSSITLPVNSRLSGSPQQNYVVGRGALEIYLNGQHLLLGVANGWTEVGVVGANSPTIVINQQLEVGDELAFRIGVAGGPASGVGGGGAADDNFVTLPTSSSADNNDYILIWDTSLMAYRKQLRSVFLSGLGNTSNTHTYSADQLIDATYDFISVDCASGPVTLSLPASPLSAQGHTWDIKKTDATINLLTIDGNGNQIDFGSSLTSTTPGDSFTIISDAGQYWII